MDVIFVLAPGHGHLYPTFGVSRALRDAGHNVTYAMVDEPALREQVGTEGHRFVAIPPPLAEQRKIVANGLREDPSLAGIFGALAPPAVAALTGLVAETGARLVLHDMASFAAPLAAALCGVTSAHFGVGPSFPDDAYDAGGAMAPMWEQWGMRPDELAGMFGRAYFDPFPPSLGNPARSLAVPCFPYQPVPLATKAKRPSVDLPRPPWVWVTLGTVFNANVVAWARLADELRSVGADLVATVGNGVDLTGGPPLPPNFTVVPFAPAQVLLEGALAVLCHAGAGTVLGALRYGLPLVCWPQGADQFHNARECEAAGASLTMKDPAGAAQALRSVLEDEQYRLAARRLREEILAMPSPAECAAVLEELAQ